jgi:hypothetical protein
MSKASIAKAKWLAPLAEILQQCSVEYMKFLQLAEEYIHDTGDPKTSVSSIEEAIQW